MMMLPVLLLLLLLLRVRSSTSTVVIRTKCLVCKRTVGGYLAIGSIAGSGYDVSLWPLVFVVFGSFFYVPKGEQVRLHNKPFTRRTYHLHLQIDPLQIYHLQYILTCRYDMLCRI